MPFRKYKRVVDLDETPSPSLLQPPAPMKKARTAAAARIAPPTPIFVDLTNSPLPIIDLTDSPQIHPTPRRCSTPVNRRSPPLPRRLFGPSIQLQDEDDRICVFALEDYEWGQQAHGQGLMEGDELFAPLPLSTEATQEADDRRRYIFSDEELDQFLERLVEEERILNAASPVLPLPAPTTPPAPMTPIKKYTSEERQLLLTLAGREAIPFSLVQNQESAAAMGFMDFPPFCQWRDFDDVDFIN